MARPARLFLVLGLSSFVVACSAAAGGGFTNGDGDGDDADSGSHHSTGGGGTSDKDGGGSSTLPDGAVVLPDGAVVDPDSGTVLNPSDGGGSSVSRISCGSSYCRGDQTCSAGSCQYACTGTQVPGDYATVQAAINATINSGSDVTLCLKAQAYAESVSISGSATTPKKLTIQGVSAASSTISALSVSGGAFSALSIRGVGFSGNVQLSSVTAPVEFVGDKLASTSSYGIYDYGSSDVTVDGCDIASSGSSYAVYFYAYYSGPAQKLTVRNSYIHDSGYGLYLGTGSYSGTGSGNVTVVNDTFDNDGYGIYTTGAGVATTLTYANDLIVNSKTYGVDQESGSTTVTAKNNALYGNANNYAGSAVDGAGYVKADVKLDTAQNPPALGSGSPARGAADKTMAPGVDFWDVVRPASPDIGAVQN